MSSVTSQDHHRCSRVVEAVRVDSTVVDRCENLVVVNVPMHDHVDVVVVQNLFESLLPCHIRFAARRAVPRSVNEDDYPGSLLSVHSSEIVDEEIDLLIVRTEGTVDVPRRRIERLRFDRTNEISS